METTIMGGLSPAVLTGSSQVVMMTERLRVGFGVSPQFAAAAPMVAVVFSVGAGVAVASGDQRAGVFPWLVAVGAACLAICCLGLVAVHGPDQSRVLVVGGTWAVLAFLALAGAFVAIGIGSVLGIDESDAGLLAAVPVVLAGFGFLSNAPALLMLALGASRVRRLPVWGIWALCFVALALPATLPIAGLVSGDLENLVPVAMLSLVGTGWVIVGLAIGPGVPAR